MGAPAELTSTMVRAAMTHFRDALRSHRDVIDRLNVFPVPDGDTGTNMMLTVESVVDELEALGPETSMADVCKA
ncbi:MAG: DAK2 domain-containing protein, partial [Acidimicrobiales bacterium]